MRQVSFSDFQFNIDLFELERNGRSIHMGRRTSDLLAYLIKNRDRVVDYDELKKEVWNSIALSRSSIPTCVRELRLALGDSASEPKYISTARGRGYRFIGKIHDASFGESGSSPINAATRFVGRKREMHLLLEKADRLEREPRAQIVVVRGEAGAGKTRLIDEFRTRATGHLHVYETSAEIGERGPTLWPWNKIVDQAVADQGNANPLILRASQELHQAYSLPIRNDLASGGSSPLANEDSALVAWSGLIKSMAANRPAVLILDDVHRTTKESGSLLSWIAHESRNERIMIVVSARPGNPENAIQKILLDLLKLPNADSIDLPPLDEDSIYQLIDPLLEGRRELSRSLAVRTGGNPFYLTHLIRNLEASKLLNASSIDVEGLPMNGPEIVAAHVSDLPTETRRFLEVASAFGKSFSTEDLSKVVSAQCEDLNQHLELAIQRGLIRPRDETNSFSHEILREAIYSGLGQARRKRIHQRIADALAQNRERACRLRQIADHSILSIPLGDLRETWKRAAAAGRDAAQTFEYSTATNYLIDAVRIAEDDDTASGETICELLLDLATCLRHSGHSESAKEKVSNAIRHARLINDSRLLAKCALAIDPDFQSIEVGGNNAELVEVLNEALLRTPAEDIETTSILQSRIAIALHWTGRKSSCEKFADKALSNARASRSRVATAIALSALADSLSGPKSSEMRLPVIEEMIEVGSGTLNRTDQIVNLTRLTTTLLELGRLSRFSKENETCRQLAMQTGLPHLLWYPHSMYSMIELMRGNVSFPSTELSDLYDAAIRLGGDRNIMQGFAAQNLFASIEADDLDAARTILAHAEKQYPNVDSWAAGSVWIAWERGELDEARRRLAEFTRERIDSLFSETGGGIGIATISEVASHLGEKWQIEHLYSNIAQLPKNGRAVAGYGVLYFGCYARYSGLLARALKKFAKARKHLSDAIELENEIGASLWSEYARLDLRILDQEAEKPGSATAGKRPCLPKFQKKWLTARLHRKATAAYSSQQPKPRSA